MQKTANSNKVTSFLYGLFVGWMCLVSGYLHAEVDDGLSLRDILNNPLDHQEVSIDGLILKRLDRNTYLIQDGTAAMQVSIPSSLAPKGGFAPKDYISVEGILNVEWGKSIEIDINSVTFSF